MSRVALVCFYLIDPPIFLVLWSPSFGKGNGYLKCWGESIDEHLRMRRKRESEKDKGRSRRKW